MRFNENFFSWTLIYSLAVWLSFKAIEKVAFPDYLLPCFVAGTIILVISLIAKKIMYKNHVIISRYTFLWLFIHSICFWVLNKLLGLLNFNDLFLYFITFGLCYNIIAWFIKYKVVENMNITIFKVLIIGVVSILVLYNTSTIAGSFKSFTLETSESYSELDEGNGLNTIVDNIKDSVVPEERDVNAIESEILRLVNEERARNGVSALTSNSKLHSFARSWSDKMISENFFEHSNLGFSYNSYAGENIMQTPIHSSVIGCGSTYNNEAMANCMVQGWIKSQGHHENMINSQFSITGIGVACDSSECKATQVFQG